MDYSENSKTSSNDPGLFCPETILEPFYESLFSGVERLIARHHPFGSWSVGSLPQLQRVPTQTELGSWYAEGRIPGSPLPGGVGIILTPGELRFGLYLPEELLHSSTRNLKDSVSLIYDGSPSCIVRQQADRTLFDWILRDTSPFDTTTLEKAMSPCREESNPGKVLIAQRLAYIITNLWVNGVRIILTEQATDTNTWLLHTASPVAPEMLVHLDSGILVHSSKVFSEGNQEYLSYIRARENEETLFSHLIAMGMDREAILSVRQVLEESV